MRLEAFAPSTRKTRASQWKSYETFCAEFHLNVFPLTSENISRFLVWKSSTVSYVTLNNYVSALNVIGKINDQRVDLREDYVIHLTLRGLRRILGDFSQPMDPLSPSDLIRIRAHVNWSSRKEAAVWTGILLAFRTLLRKSHFFEATQEDVHLLTKWEVKWTSWGFIIIISRSKTIQFGQRKFEAPVCRCQGLLCAVSALRDLWGRGPQVQDSPIISDEKDEPIQYRDALRPLKDWCKKAHIDKNVGLHSLRRGMATYMKEQGFSLLDIQLAGDWQSLSVLRYLSTSSERKKNIDWEIASSFPISWINV